MASEHEHGSAERHFDVPAVQGEEGWEHIDFSMGPVPWILDPEKATKEQLLKQSEELRVAISTLEKFRSYLKNKAEELDDK